MINCQVSKLLASEFIERQYSEPKNEIVSSNPPILRLSVDHFSIISEHLQPRDIRSLDGWTTGLHLQLKGYLQLVNSIFHTWIWRTQILALFRPIAGSNTDVSKIKTEGYWINVPYDWLGNHDYGVDDKLVGPIESCISDFYTAEYAKEEMPMHVSFRR
ncbi:uncharacterized protein RSE6_03258 [Rhynchosporium secalis]|uniref:Uncharacterized protein n=1 Tax=Rhynchosporium secalis TaxID=38038 RepID=A0A1E1M2A7_RHYSE|nr:uncharacterized protein RSE6_03258 [Rhynchosporium secalis]